MWHNSETNLLSIKSGANGRSLDLDVTSHQFYDHSQRLLPGPVPRSQTSIRCESHLRIGSAGGLKLFTKFNKIYHRRGTRAHAENFIVVNSLVHSETGVLMKRERDGDDEGTFVCNSDHLEGEHTNHEEILPQ